MRTSIQLQIPTPCGENWENMQLAERGRHCQHCCKTVVDFTMMSDEEIIRHLTKAPGANVCGRLMPDQLGRKLAPAAVQRNGWSGWHWVVASVLMLAKGTDNPKPANPFKQEWRDSRGKKVAAGEIDQDSTVVIVGTISAPVNEIPVPADTVVKCEAFMGELAIPPRPLRKPRRASPADSGRVHLPTVAVLDSPAHPTVKIPVSPNALQFSRNESSVTMHIGGITVGRQITAIQAAVDTITKAVADTLTVFGIFPNNELSIYPNPVPRGSSLQIAWKSGPGKFQLALYDAGGALVQRRMVEVAGKGQVDQWEMPTGLAAGIYVLRAAKEGSSKVYTREVVLR